MAPPASDSGLGRSPTTSMTQMGLRIGSITGILVGAIVVVGLSNVLLPILTQALQRAGVGSTDNVLSSPDNYKYLIFGLALVLMMRYRPDGIVHSRKAVRK